MAVRAFGIYRATPPTLSDGAIHPLLLDANGRLITVPDNVLRGETVHGTGAILTATTALTYTYTVTVVAGSMYRIKANDGLLYFGMGAGGTAANVSWSLSAGEQMVITIPSGAGTTLYYHSTSDGVTGRIAKVKV